LFPSSRTFSQTFSQTQEQDQRAQDKTNPKVIFSTEKEQVEENMVIYVLRKKNRNSLVLEKN
jgi:hypothetical protein